MGPTTRILAVATVAVPLLLAGCGSAVPSTSDRAAPLPGALEATASSDVTPAPPDVIAGPWGAEPIPLADSQIAVVSDACAAAARAQLGEVEAELPTAVVDTRGEGRFVAILSDGGVGIDCVGRLTEAGAAVATLDRLAVDSVAPVDATDVAVTEVAGMEDTAPWTVAFGRSGPDATGARLGFGDGSLVSTTTGVGWWAAWWPGAKVATKVESLDATGAVARTATVPGAGVESRLVTATWWLDGTAPKPADANALKILVRENACAGGQSGVDRLDPPTMDFGTSSITIRLDIRRRPGAQDCLGVAPFPFTLELPEAVGGRTLLDASTRPPRDATKPPPNG